MNPTLPPLKNVWSGQPPPPSTASFTTNMPRAFACLDPYFSKAFSLEAKAHLVDLFGYVPVRE